MDTFSCSATVARLGNRPWISDSNLCHGSSSSGTTMPPLLSGGDPSKTSSMWDRREDVSAWSTNTDTTAMVILATSVTTTMPPPASFLPSRSTAAFTLVSCLSGGAAVPHPSTATSEPEDLALAARRSTSMQ
ncbi:hypothetical protein PR202_gb16867 [Eleusine coracana subsp. coracana]|uniref:Uncharacterized protein n=1 Tax=Eleusine coracana subsp. coracana TaxID=191504 RepID=A0AAV5F2Y5_ELECO|nr:hypothetical protein PR202_gb16867 [Eleusine coracana subsp. coracana]